MIIKANKSSHLDEYLKNNSETSSEDNDMLENIKVTIEKNKEIIEKNRKILNQKTKKATEG